MDIIYTNRQQYTPAEVVDMFTGYVTDGNMDVLVHHLTDPKLSKHITGFIESGGVVHFQVNDNHMVPIRRKELLYGC